MNNRDLVRQRVAVAKESPTSSAVHVDTIMGNESTSPRRKKKRKKAGLVEAIESLEKAKNVPTDKELYARVKAEAKKKFDVYPSAYANAWLVREYKSRGGTYKIEKASFASRSEAGRYAANQRWKGQGKKETKTTTPKPASPKRKTGVGRVKHDLPKKPSTTQPLSIPDRLKSSEALNVINNYKTSIPKVFSDKQLVKSAEMLKKRGAGDGTISKQDRDVSKEMENLITKTLDEENAKIGDALKQLQTQGSDKETALKSLRSSASSLRRAQTKMLKEQESRGLKPSKLEENTIAGMAIFTASSVFGNIANAVLREIAQAKKTVSKASSPAWQREEGKNPKGGLNAKGRASYKRKTGGTLKPPVKAGDNPRRASFLARMGNAPGPERDANGEPTRLLLSLQAWGANSKAEARKKAKAISARNKNKDKA